MNEDDRLPAEEAQPVAAAKGLAAEIAELIQDARQAVARAVNSGLTLLYWQIGQCVQRELLKGERADYGQQILATVAQQLTRDFGRGFSYSALTRMVRLYEVYPDQAIVATLSQVLSWSHFRELLPLEHPLQRDFYAEMCRIERWSVRTLREKIGSMLYERTALSKKPGELARIELQALRETDLLSPDLVFRDPYLLDFLGLKDTYHEKDLEAAILANIESFLLELGGGFSFLARQKRISLDDDDFYLDLLFFHRDLRRLIAVELKLDRFRPAHLGQMELYLRWLNKHERRPGEGEALGLILCAGKKQEQIELLELGRAGIHVAEYLTDLPSREVMRKKLHEAIELSRRQLTRADVEQ